LTLSEIQDIMDECKYILDHYKDWYEYQKINRPWAYST
jgi:hypothetical protein